MTPINRRWCVGSLRDAPPALCLGRDLFVYSESPILHLAEGQVLVKARYIAPDPMVHAWARGVMPGLAGFAPMQEGLPLRGMVGGEVIQSRHTPWKVGERVTGALDWADFTAADGTDYLGLPLERVSDGLSLETTLGTLGMNGRCAYFGLFDVGRPIPGDTVPVTGASGAIGSVAAQLARLAGAYVVGTAGGAEKCRILLGLRLDRVVDYRQGDLAAQLGDA